MNFLGVIQIVIGLLLILFNKQFGLVVLKSHNFLWGLDYQNETPNRVGCVLVGTVFIVLGGLDLLGLTHLR